MSTVPAKADSEGHGQEMVPAIDVQLFAETIRQASAPRLAVPSQDRITRLAGLLRGHAGLLLSENLGPDEGELKAIRREAEALLGVDASESAMTRGQRWEYVQCLAAATKGLLRWFRAAARTHI